MDPLVFFFAYIVPMMVIAVIGGLVYAYLRRPFLSALDLQVLSIKIPRRSQDEKEGQKDFLLEINQTEQLFNSLSSIKKPFVFEVAVENNTEHINFYLAVPRQHVDFAKRQVQGLFLDAEVLEAPEYNIFSPSGESAGGYLKLDQASLLPLRTYREAEADTFAPILSTLSKLKEVGDGAAIQILVTPAFSSERKQISSGLERLKRGESAGAVFGGGSVIKEIDRAIFGRKKTEGVESPKIVDEEAVKAVSQKLSKPLYSVITRIVASSNDPGRAEEIFLSIAGAFSQFTASSRNSFKIQVPKKLKKLFFEYSFREWNPTEQTVLNSEEIASLIHLPTGSSDVPRISWLRTKEVAPPANLSTEGVILGENIFRGDRRLVRMQDADRRRHLYVIGQTGTGKSYKLFTPMIMQDIVAGKGVCVIDPHGDLVDNVLDRIPPERIDDVIVFDPGDLRRPLGLNMLEYNLAKPEEKSFIVGEILKIFDRLYDLKTTGGPMFEYYLRNALLLMLGDAAHEQVTLLDVPRIFSDADYRNDKLSRCKDPLVVDFWTKEASKATGDQGLGNMTVYIVSKFASFISNDYMRPVIGQIKSSFNIRELMDNKKILLVKLAKGKIGEQNANLLGMIITGRILMAALARGDLRPADRSDFFFYIDEFQNFTTDSISTILSEARKYGLCLTVAHQFISQLEDDIREAVFGNVGSLVAFRVGASDTEYLLKHFAPEFSDKDLTTVENYKAFAKLLVNGEPIKPFSFTCIDPVPGSPELREKLLELSRLTYGRDLAEVEREIVAKLRPNAEQTQAGHSQL
ncbi:MAG: type IV secretion system DNA-binding domain-containing protein [Candidatus Vogelbacteria bacterium]|nr:type IV secretion system DNA-binding domain-containing protein [Candidatus Vogelbacteria bacterium]